PRRRDRPLLGRRCSEGRQGALIVVSRCAAERTGFEPVEGCYPLTGLANRRYRPLSHLSIAPFPEDSSRATSFSGIGATYLFLAFTTRYTTAAASLPP